MDLVPLSSNLMPISAAPEGRPLRFDVKWAAPVEKDAQIDVAFVPESNDRFSQASLSDFKSVRAYRRDNGRPITMRRVRGGFVVHVPKGLNGFILELATSNNDAREAPEHFKLQIGSRIVSGVIGADPVFNASLWWRQAGWFRQLLFGQQSEWRNKWLNPSHAPQAFYRENGIKKSYNDAVLDCLGTPDATYNLFGDARNFAKLARLLEIYLKGEVFDARHTVILPAKGRYQFTSHKVQGVGFEYSRASIPMARNKKEILITGDSITDEGSRIGVWTRALREHIRKNHPHWSVWNLAVSGSSTSSAPEGLSQKANLANALKINPTPGVVVITMTVNGLLRGDPLDQMKNDVKWMVGKALKHGAEVVLIGGYRPFVTGDYAPQLTPQDRAFLSARGLSHKASGYAAGLSLMYDEVASLFVSDIRFTYVQNFWAPLDGSQVKPIPKKFVGRIKPLQGLSAYQKQLGRSLMDPVHPKADASIARNLAQQINAVVGGSITASLNRSAKAAEGGELLSQSMSPGLVPTDYAASVSGLDAVWQESPTAFMGLSPYQFDGASTQLLGLDNEDPFRRGRLVGSSLFSE